MAKPHKIMRRILKELETTTNYTVKPDRGLTAEVWQGRDFVCLLTMKDGKWGATHNMEAIHAPFDTPIQAIQWYKGL